MAHRAPDDAPAHPVFVCAACGRSDLPEAGGWEPPICLDCDAAINLDAEEAETHWES